MGRDALQPLALVACGCYLVAIANLRERAMPWPDAITLEGRLARLEPLAAAHEADLVEAAADGELHRLWYTTVPAPHRVGAEIERRLALRAAGSMLPFAVIDRATGKAAGMTTYMNIEAGSPRLEIGSTWYRKAIQRTGINTECKRLLLGHAFEALGCIAVELRTHVMNQQSRRAIERLGARLDGILRSHMVMANGTLRDTCVYSIVAHDWPAVRANLDFMMEKARQT